MKIIRIIVVSPEKHISQCLSENLSGSVYEIIDCRPGSEKLVELGGIADIAVIDRIDEQLDLSRFEITVLKKAQTNLPIIVISQYSTGRDADVINQGVFYYLAGYSEQRLLRVVRAAADQIRNGTETATESKSIKN